MASGEQCVQSTRDDGFLADDYLGDFLLEQLDFRGELLENRAGLLIDDGRRGLQRWLREVCDHNCHYCDGRLTTVESAASKVRSSFCTIGTSAADISPFSSSALNFASNLFWPTLAHSIFHRNGPFSFSRTAGKVM